MRILTNGVLQRVRYHKPQEQHQAQERHGISLPVEAPSDSALNRGAKEHDK